MFQTGTIVAFSGTGFVSQGIRWRTWSQWSHVGLIVDITAADVDRAANTLTRLDDQRVAFLLDHPPGICLLESTTQLAGTRCLVTDRDISGVQCTLPGDRIRGYTGRVASLEPIRPLGGWQRAELARLALTQCGTPYDARGVALLATVAWKYLRGPRAADRSSLYCAEVLEMDLGKIGLGFPRCCMKPGFSDPRKTVEWRIGFTHRKPKWETKHGDETVSVSRV